MKITRELSITIESSNDPDFALRFVTAPGACMVRIFIIATDHGFPGQEFTNEFDVTTCHDPIFNIEQLERIAVEWIESDDMTDLGVEF